ncbi:hypothetical protein [Mammaliicoccus vitulinus]|uniref:Uncharacterized protein n=1 Tax=Mammaliicoccus vitulinus TaxID=71237 RepID=A0ABX7HFV4_9STAP|nr:hypothetical protein [Mammaliicoccus vitulinus]PNZ40918.1 hypothetical protein CD107_00930 [Mammaliicoccus vitulinus]QRO85142.1 hypothetical protein I6J37_00085 [Mammaliicoccus vitulinus]
MKPTLISKLMEKQIHFTIESDTKGEGTITIPLSDIAEIEIIKNSDYKISMPSTRPFTPPTITTFQTEQEVIEFLFKED